MIKKTGKWLLRLWIYFSLTLWWTWIMVLIFTHQWFGLISFGVCFMGMIAQAIWNELKKIKQI